MCVLLLLMQGAPSCEYELAIFSKQSLARLVLGKVSPMLT